MSRSANLMTISDARSGGFMAVTAQILMTVRMANSTPGSRLAGTASLATGPLGGHRVFKRCSIRGVFTDLGIRGATAPKNNTAYLS